MNPKLPGSAGRAFGLGLQLLAVGVAGAAKPPFTADTPAVDFRYSPPWWQSLVCLPDDPDKPLVGKEGQFFFDFGRGGPRGFTFSVSPQIEGGSRWLSQQTVTARAPVIQTRKATDGIEVIETAFLVIPEQAKSSRGGERSGEVEAGAGVLPKRENIVLLHFRNFGREVASCRPLLQIEGAVPVRFEAAERRVAIGSETSLLGSEGIESCLQEGRAWVARLPEVRLAAGEEKEIAITILRRGSPPVLGFSAARARQARDETLAWWRAADLPFGVIEVPDDRIQAMLEASVRNIWQAREIIDERPAFHVGPTHYRCLWVADGAFLLETAAMLGRTEEARAGIDHLLAFQAPHGGFELKPKYWKEDGLVLWTLVRHARLTNDRDWLRRQWPRLERIVEHIRELRREASADPAALHFELLPPGDPAGGAPDRDRTGERIAFVRGVAGCVGAPRGRDPDQRIADALRITGTGIARGG